MRPSRVTFSSLSLVVSFLTLFSQCPPNSAVAAEFLENGNARVRNYYASTFRHSVTRRAINLAGTWQVSEDGEHWRKVKVPSAGLFYGKMIFVRTFEVPDSLLGASRFQLVADGINERCEIWINNSYIGEHEGGYTSFALPVSSANLRAGSGNTIKIVVDDRLNVRRTLPPQQQVFGWKTYGGIYRDIFLLATPLISIGDVIVDPLYDIKARRADVNLSVNFEVTAKEAISEARAGGKRFLIYAEVYQTFPDAFVARSAAIEVDPVTHASQKLSISIANPSLWSPEDPHLYQVRVVLVSAKGSLLNELVDEYWTSFGLRSLVVERGRLQLNGEPLIIKGIAWVEDSPEFGSALSYEVMEKDIALIKSLGANALRVMFHPPHPYVVDLCDRYGLLLFEEIPAWNVPEELLEEEGFQEAVRKSLREMVGRDRNHPSVVGWGLMSSFDSSIQKAEELLSVLAQELHDAGDHHLTYTVTSLVKTDRSGDAVDLPMVDLQGSEADGLKQAALLWNSRYPSKPFLVGAFGDVVEHGNHRGYSDPYSEESQATRFVQYGGIIRELNLSGGFLLSFADWRGDVPTMVEPPGEKALYSLGLLSYQREKRIAYSVVRAMFSGERVPALPIGSSSSHTPMSFVLVGLLLLIVVVYSLNQSRHFRENVSRSLFRSYNFFADVRDERITSAPQVVFFAALLSMIVALIIGSILYHYRFDAVADRLLTFLSVFPSVKAVIINLTWTPTTFLLYGTLTIFVLGLLCALAVWVLSLLGRTRIRFLQAFQVVVWSASPALFMVVLGMIFLRLMEIPLYVIPLLIFVAIIGCWTFLRFFRALTIVYDVPRGRFYGLAVLLLAMLALVVGLILNHELLTYGYLRFLLHFAEGTIGG